MAVSNQETATNAANNKWRDKDFPTPTQAAEMLGIGRMSIYRYIRNGKIKFVRFERKTLHGGVIARFVKKVFEKPLESTQFTTIEQKLKESKSTKERISIHTCDQMDKQFKHFQRYGNINLDVLNRA